MRRIKCIKGRNRKLKLTLKILALEMSLRNWELIVKNKVFELFKVGCNFTLSFGSLLFLTLFFSNYNYHSDEISD